MCSIPTILKRVSFPLWHAYGYRIINNISDGLHALAHFLSDRPTNAVPPTDFIISLTDWIIHNNVFMFMNGIYKQLIGVPMGSCFLPNYACLYLGHWEELFVLTPTNPWCQYYFFMGEH